MVRTHGRGVLRRAPRQQCHFAEGLEVRLLLASLPVNHPIVTIDWKGQQTQAMGGQYILSLNPRSQAIRHRPLKVQERMIERVIRKTADRGSAVAGVSVEKYLGRPGSFLLGGSNDLTYKQVLSSANHIGGFRYLQPNFVFSLQSIPSDPLFNYQWGLHNTGTTPLGPSKPDADIDAPEAWDLTTGSGDIVVGMIDSGVDYNHPDLVANMWHNPFETPGDGIDNDRNGYVDDYYGINALANTGNPMDDNGHGTHTAGGVAAVGNNAQGVAGTAWNAKIMALKFLNAQGNGATADAIECLNYAVSMKQRGVNIRLTNNSWGASATFNPALRDAISATADAGMLFIAAAGNGGADAVGDNNDTTPLYPASFDLPNIITVAATDRNDNLGTMSNYGATSVDLAAPGVEIASTGLNATYVHRSGTSQAAPFVSGVAVLAWSLRPGATYAQVRDAILAGVDPLPNLAGKVATGGRLNALGTLRALTNSVSGIAFDDANGNGVRDTGEGTLSGRTIWLDLDNDGAVDPGEPTRVTDAAGSYRFGGLQPGSYTVRQVVPSGWVGTAPPAGFYTVTIADGQDNPGRDFGSRVVPANPPPTATATLGDVTSGGAYYWITVTYADDTAVDYRTIGNGDVQVTGPNAYSQPGILSNLTTANGKWTATYRVPAPGGSWNAADNGAYTVSMQPNEVADTAGAFVPPGSLGQFTVQLSDSAPPTATLTATDVTSPGGAYYWFTVTYADDTEVDYRTIGDGDVQVTGPNGYSQLGTLSNLTTSADGKWTTTYWVPAPGGTWDAADSGTYTVSMRANEVADTAGKFVPAGTLGTFSVRLGDPVPPTASLSASDVTAAAAYYYFTVNYSDNVAVNYTTIDSNDVLVTGPNAYSQVGTLVNLVTAAGTWSATYRVVAPGGTFGPEDNGTYTISLQPNQVADTAGNFAVAGTLGTFQVAIPTAAPAAVAEPIAMWLSPPKRPSEIARLIG